MKTYTLFVFFLIAFLPSFAQSPIARIKFEQAEEAFQNDQYQNVLFKLEEAEKLLGEINPKILYLRILAQNKLVVGDLALLPALKTNCADYLKQTESNSSLIEKYKEVYFISEGLRQLEDDKDHIIGKKFTDEQKDKEALPYYLKAAARGYSRSLNNLGVMYLWGNGVEKDAAKALMYFQSAAEKGGLGGQVAMYNLGNFYSNGKETSIDLDKAKSWFLKGAESGHAFSMYWLANTYYNENDHLKAFKWSKTGADLNHLPSIELAIYYYMRGAGGVQKDLPKALFYAKKGVEQNNAYSLYYLGYLNEFGLGTPVNFSDALAFYARAATLGNIKAYDGLARLYEEGKGVKKDRRIAADWIRKKQEMEASQKALKFGLQNK